MPRVALLQQASGQAAEEGVQGMLDGLAAGGFVVGKTVEVQRFNAENDVATANAIARQITSGAYDLVLTVTTRSLQAVANANRDGRVKHVFGIVADPQGAGVGISRTNPLDHPKHLVGIGSFIPPDKAFRLARRMYPALKAVGVAWNPAESNSEAFLIKAREICHELNIRLLEVAVDNSSAVGEASQSLVSQGAEALWISGDVTVIVAADSVIGAARQGHIPTFTIVPPSAQQGALFDLGADFHDVGKQTGELAAKVLTGADLTKIPILNSVPLRLLVNRGALKGLTAPWRIPPDVLTSAERIIE
jgi:putative ABC transport system substrate-binding protein